jgi:RNA polymerase sigma factor (sigma-70 family)
MCINKCGKEIIINKIQFENFKTKLLYSKPTYYEQKVLDELIDKPDVAISFAEAEQLPGYYQSVTCLDIIHSVAQKLSGGNEPLKTELFSEGLVHLTEAYLTWSPEKAASFRTFVGTSVRNGVLNYMRKEGRWSNEDPSDTIEEVEGSMNPEDLCLDKQQHDAFWNAIGEMFPNLVDLERAIVLNRFMTPNAEPSRQLASRFGVSAMTVIRRERKLRKILVKEIEKWHTSTEAQA